MKQKNLRSVHHTKAPAQPSKAPSRRSSRSSRPALKIPSILFEGDLPGQPVAAGAGEKFALGPGPPPAHAQTQAGHLPEVRGKENEGLENAREAPKAELPEAYGAGKVLLLAQEPHGLYAHWDLTPDEQRRHNARSIHRHLVLRVHAAESAGQPVVEQHVHASSRSWFVQVNGAATSYVAELGYYRAEDKWVSIGSSSAAVTPPDTVSETRTVQYATVSRGPTVLEGRPAPRRLLVQGELFQEGVEAGKVAGQFGGVQGTERPIAPEWALAQERVIAEESALHQIAREQAGSMEIAELVRGYLEREGPSASVSSAWGGEQERPKEFWLNVGTDLIVHGGTEPDAHLAMNGQPIVLRPDGTFSCQVALPDGEYEAIIEAVSARGEVRNLRLTVRRCTEWGTADGGGESIKSPD